MISLFSKSFRLSIRKGCPFFFQRSFGRKRVVSEVADAIEESVNLPPETSNHTLNTLKSEFVDDTQDIQEKQRSDTKQVKQYKISHQIASSSILSDAEIESLEELKSSGFSDLGINTRENCNNQRKQFIQQKELLSHVPQEMSVVKYGYVENRVLSTLETLLDTGGFISPKALNAISIVSMSLEDDGRDINIHYRLNQSDSDLSLFHIENSRYIEKHAHPRQINKKNISYLKKEKERMESTHKYKDFKLTLDDVSIIDEITKSTKRIRYALCKQLNIKRVPQLHFIHDVK